MSIKHKYGLIKNNVHLHKRLQKQHVQKENAPKFNPELNLEQIRCNFEAIEKYIKWYREHIVLSSLRLYR